jgi:hypothetical protein
VEEDSEIIFEFWRSERVRVFHKFLIFKSKGRIYFVRTASFPYLIEVRIIAKQIVWQFNAVESALIDGIEFKMTAKILLLFRGGRYGAL